MNLGLKKSSICNEFSSYDLQKSFNFYHIKIIEIYLFVAAVVQWCQRSPHKPVFPGSNPGGGSCLSQTAGDVSKVFIAMKKHSGSDSTLNSRSILSMFCLSALQLRKNITASALTRKRVVIASVAVLKLQLQICNLFSLLPLF